jgi:HemY protein
MLSAGKTSKAQAAVEAGWRIAPHPALALLWRDLRHGETNSQLAKRLKNLAGTNPTHHESRILTVEAALAEGKWEQAEETLVQLLAERETTRTCALMETATKGQNKEEEAAKWSRLASSAPREADWTDIDTDGRAFNYARDDWARLVYSFGDESELIHPRYETYGGELETLAHIALPTPKQELLSEPEIVDVEEEPSDAPANSDKPAS